MKRSELWFLFLLFLHILYQFAWFIELNRTHLIHFQAFLNQAIRSRYTSKAMALYFESQKSVTKGNWSKHIVFTEYGLYAMHSSLVVSNRADRNNHFDLAGRVYFVGYTVFTQLDDVHDKSIRIPINFRFMCKDGVCSTEFLHLI